MKKIIILTSIFLTMSFWTMAQREGKTRFSIGPELGYATSNPLNSFPGNKGWGLGIGASAEVEHFFQESASGIFYIGILSYKGRSSGTDLNGVNTNNKAYTVIPIRVGGNIYAGSRLHLGAQIGVGLNSRGGKGTTAFAYTPQIGYNFSKNDHPLDLTFKYDGYAGNGSFSALGLRLSLIL
ncbi:MAG TPA: hypothetical protein VFI29_16140 [Hanamia sp.]|nr:hypothetical protein [Hanamia sp.]